MHALYNKTYKTCKTRVQIHPHERGGGGGWGKKARKLRPKETKS